MKPNVVNLPEGTRVVSGAVDDTMAYAVLTWAHSLSAHGNTRPHLIIGYLDGLLSGRNRNTLTLALDFLSISHEFVLLDRDDRFIQQGHISPTTFTKFQLADLIPIEHVWIDIDTVATSGWEDIFSEIASAPSRAKLVVSERGEVATGVQGSGQQSSELAFNAGVLGWPARPRIPWSKALDELDLTETQEQYLFNALYANHLITVSERFNALTYRYDRVDPQHRPFITHYAGAHKPWHLPRRYSRTCMGHHCPWSLWFEEEQRMLHHLQRFEHLDDIIRLQEEALRSGSWGLAGNQRGRALLHVLRILGPLGWVPLFLAKPFRHILPRGTHPIH